MERLSRLHNYDVSRHDPDPRGWKVVDESGRTVGEVSDLLVDTDRMTASYLDVELDTKLFDLRDDDPHVLVPVDRAHRDGRRLVVEELNRKWVGELLAERERHQHTFWREWWARR